MSLSSIYLKASLSFLSKGKVKEALGILKYLVKVQLDISISLKEIDKISELLKHLEEE